VYIYASAVCWVDYLKLLLYLSPSPNKTVELSLRLLVTDGFLISVVSHAWYIQLVDILFTQLESRANNRSGSIPMNFKV